MRRSLVLTDEKARHPFLASLPPHVRSDAKLIPVRRVQPSWARDLRDFLMAYATCFLVVSIYIA